MEDRLLAPKEVAGILGVQVNHVYDLIESGRMGAIDIGTREKARWRIRKSEVDSYLARRSRASKSERREIA